MKRVANWRYTKTSAANSVPITGTTGIIDISLLATGTPDGTKFVRDDGTLQAAGAGGSHATTHEDGGVDATKIGTKLTPSVSLSLAASYGLVVPSEYTLGSGIELTLESGSELLVI